MLKHSCQRRGCTRIRSEFSLFLTRRAPPRFEGQSFCSETCLRAQVEQEVASRWELLLAQKSRRVPRPRLGTILLQGQQLSREQLDEAVARQQHSGEGRIGEWLLRLGFIEEHQITRALSRQFGIPSMDLRHCEIQPGAVKLVPGAVARCAGLLPVGIDERHAALRLAVSDPADFGAQAALRRMLRREVTAFVADRSAIEALIERFYPESAAEGDGICFRTRGELLCLVRDTLRSAVEGRASELDFELLERYAWMRVDFPEGPRHEVFRRGRPCPADAAAAALKPGQLACAAAR
jgi:hypothetical protein